MQLRQNTKITLKQEHNSTGIKRVFVFIQNTNYLQQYSIGQNQNLFVTGASSASTVCFWKINVFFQVIDVQQYTFEVP